MPRMDRPIEKQEKVVVWNWGLKDLDTPNLGERGYHADLDGVSVMALRKRRWRASICLNLSLVGNLSRG